VITWVANYTDFRRDYSLDDLSPSSFLGFAQTFRSNATAATLYSTHYRRSFSENKCESDSCMKDRYCGATNVDPIEGDQCRGKNHFDFKGDLFNSIFEVLQSPWVRFFP
jgi:hypothetical protein